MRKMKRGFEVMAEPCKQCLFSKNRIPSASRAQELIRSCLRQGKHFTCHKASLADRDVCCNGFYKCYPNSTLGMRVSRMFGLDRFVREEELTK